MTCKSSLELKTCGCASAGNNTAVLVDGYDPANAPRWIEGPVQTDVGIAPRAATALGTGDIVGSWKARWGIGRMNYRVGPGLYAVGKPDATSPVLVTANYKMTFDRLRRELHGIDTWIVVLDTNGINVWCAAGKGTFGTDEIVRRVKAVRLAEIVSHRVLILPQLGAPGVAAHKVLQQTGFHVVYGPVRAADIPAFLEAGNKATPAMREVQFNFIDRLVLTPIELTAAIKPALVLLGMLFLLMLIKSPSASFLVLVERTFIAFVPFFGAILTGAVAAPCLLPCIPGRAFAWKGWLAGLAWSLVFIAFSSIPAESVETLFYVLVLPAISSYLTMNFTGASTYTSLSGVLREMKTALRAITVSAASGVAILGGATAVRVLGIF